MPSNQQRREAAKRKLQRQLVRREVARARRRRTSLIVGVVAVVVVAAGVVWLVNSAGSGTPTASGAADSGASGTAATATSGPMTPCTYTPSGTAAKPVQPPSNTSPAREGTVSATMSLNGETVDLTLNRAFAPCSVNSFLSLASQGFYNDTTCHRLTKSAALNVLQCGDPSGKGNGGPGYEYAPQPVTEAKYTEGTLAMANASAGQGAASEGSQFFIVYGPTTISPTYTIIGTVSKAGMKVVDSIAAQGVTDDRQDGKPIARASIEKITVPGDAVSASTQWPTSSAADSGAIDTQAPPAAEPTEAPGTQPPADTDVPAEPSAPTESTAAVTSAG